MPLQEAPVRGSNSIKMLWCVRREGVQAALDAKAAELQRLVGEKDALLDKTVKEKDALLDRTTKEMGLLLETATNDRDALQDMVARLEGTIKWVAYLSP